MGPVSVFTVVVGWGVANFNIFLQLGSNLAQCIIFYKFIPQLVRKLLVGFSS